jgi:protoporphyrin/coproporphyrin ferrochelatase
LAGEKWVVPPISALPEFYNEPGFIDAWVDVSQPVLDEFRPDYILFSYHGLPESQVLKSDDTGEHCLKKANCCETLGGVNKHCYRAQCMETTRLIAARLGLTAENHGVSFQSRLGRDPWIKPATDEIVPGLAKAGKKRLAVLCPAFVTDCLETLEEIGIRAKEDFVGAGGEDCVQIPCLNTNATWMDTLATMLKRI